MKSVRFMLSAAVLGLASLLATPAAQASTIPEDAVVLSCTEVAGFYSVRIFHNGIIYDVFSDTCPLNP
ncbi:MULTISPECIES: hypothetical protein [Oceanicaulis]|mgnify:FL=1|jgi:hypothetical protein|uniref:hypothetical protein n=1 Tax=Oceanicaulis TaxID=153232 RepID=UPI0003B3604A|nr:MULTISPECIES: hypothetical protein [Oceanicaulis]MBL4538097.1 hypothetical protein [Oceanicaulis sp.]VXC49840.1 conserved exported hypothetical protein [Oceanicaulis sp. 350]HCR65051.1 hypothetical protein [Oceanicaulis sp.]|tara:strand:- start:145 stop:348 length:204 start_codon:yes stop_codon:yes gene_type:complete